ncbi:ankyrin repeat domain-containing protein 40-like [Littorina saxatilis]|uniref:Ankyrin repeat domain-containing protein 40 n=1 Tax=Littorina saxatilis TaxID=31220 RepID=A0AAN9GM00_9CAEN
MEEIQKRELEEKMREAASIGDMALLRNLVELKNIDVNSQNNMNGRSALHWAAKRNHQTVVEYLLTHGADRQAVDKDGKTAEQLTSSAEVNSLLGGSGDLAEAEQLPFVPNYLAHPPFPYGSDSQLPSSDHSASSGDRISQSVIMNNHSSSMSSQNELVLKIRVAYTDDSDFIEVELPRVHLQYEALLNMMCAELGVDKQLVWRIRKLPNTVVRKDKDVARLQDFQELELVLTNKAMSATSRGYRGIQTNTSMTKEQILY